MLFSLCPRECQFCASVLLLTSALCVALSVWCFVLCFPLCLCVIDGSLRSSCCSLLFMLCCSCVASVLAPFSCLLLVPWRTLITNGGLLFCVLCFVFCVLCFVFRGTI